MSMAAFEQQNLVPIQLKSFHLMNGDSEILPSDQPIKNIVAIEEKN